MRTLLFATLLLLPSVGCLGFRPVGVLDPDGAANRAAEMAVMNEVERLPEAPPPPAPTRLISPDEIDPANPAEAVRKLAAEIETDRRAVEQFPNYPKVSKVSLR